MQYYCTTALSNIAVDGNNLRSYSVARWLIQFGIAHNRKKLAQSEPKLVSSLVQLMDSPSLKVQCQAALALRNLASDGAPIFSRIAQLRADVLAFREVPARDCEG